MSLAVSAHTRTGTRRKGHALAQDWHDYMTGDELMRQLSLLRCTVGQQLKVAAVVAFELFWNAPPTGDRLVRSPVGGAFALGALVRSRGAVYTVIAKS